MGAAVTAHRQEANLLVRAAEAWSRFWFTPADPATLGLIRVLCGTLVLYVHFVYSFDLQEMFGRNAWIASKTMNESRREVPIGPVSAEWVQKPPDFSNLTPEDRVLLEKWGVTKSMAIDQGLYHWSIWYHVDDPTWMAIIHGAILVNMFFFAIGFATRITSVLTWVSILCYINREPPALFGMDTIMIVVTTYLMIGPSGAFLSVDRILARRFWPDRTEGKEQTRPTISANFAIRLMQIHLCMIYGASGISKMQGGAWWMGTAVWGTLANPEFSPMQSDVYMGMLTFLCQHRWLWEVVVTSLTYGTLVFETAFPFLVWSPRMRFTMVMAAVMLHIGIAICMGLVCFSLMMLTLILSFVPPDAVREMLHNLAWFRESLAKRPTRLD